MILSNAYSGVSKVFASEILNILSTLVMFAATLYAVTLSDDIKIDTNPVQVFTLFGLTVASSLFGIIAFIVQLVGLNQARRDEKLFKKAMYFVGICALCTIALTFSRGMFGRICAGIDEISTLLIHVFIIIGIFAIADRLENTSMQKSGKIILLFVSIMFIAAFFLQIASSIAPEYLENFAFVSTILEFAGYVLGTVYVGMAKKMLTPYR